MVVAAAAVTRCRNLRVICHPLSEPGASTPTSNPEQCFGSWELGVSLWTCIHKPLRSAALRSVERQRGAVDAIDVLDLKCHLAVRAIDAPLHRHHELPVLQ